LISDARTDAFLFFVRARVNRKEVRVYESAGPNRFEQSLPLSPSLGSEFWEGSGRGGGRGVDKCKGTNIQFEREIMLRTNREKRMTGKGKGCFLNRSLQNKRKKDRSRGGQGSLGGRK